MLSETERESIVGSLENERQVRFSGRGAMLDGKREVLVASSEVEIGVAPSVELGASAEGLTGAKMAGSLSGVVDEDDGEMEPSLKLPEVTEDGGDLGGKILVDSVESDEGVEEKEPGPEAVEGIDEAVLVELGVEPQRRCGDHVDIERGEIELEVGA